MDIAELLARPHDMNVGDAAHHLEGFAAEMASVGYSPLTIGGYLDSVIHFGGWLQARGLSLPAIDDKIVKAFGAHRCKCPGRRSYPAVSRAYIARVERFVRYIGQQGVIRLTVNSVPEAPASLIAFREWLLQHRGLAPAPAQEMQQIHGITAQGGLRHATNPFAIQETIDPLHFTPSRLIYDPIRTASSGSLRLMDYIEGHRRAASNSWRNCRASPPCTKKLLGSSPAGNSTRRVFTPCARTR